MVNSEVHEVLIAAVAAVPATVASLITLVVALRTKERVHEVHQNTNSMKDALVAATEKLARLEGFAAGVASMTKPQQSDDLT
jgi:hypothetical protein